MWGNEIESREVSVCARVRVRVFLSDGLSQPVLSEVECGSHGRTATPALSLGR